MAHQRHGADVIILDDGFQHRRLARDLDIVLIDTTCPFGYDHLLPRGLLREPLRALRRADVIIMTRCDQMAHSKLQQVETRLARLAPAALRLKCNHVVIGVERLDGEPISKSLEGVPVVVVAGIGQPGAFLHTVHTLGAEVVGARWWPDHHHYTKGDLETLFKPGSFPPHEYILTTEKDAVKISKLTGINTAMIGVVRIAIDFMGNDGTMLQKRLLEALAQEVKA